MTELLARYAENVFWMARYVERAENLARLLDVNDVASRDLFGEARWDAVVTLNADDAPFAAKHDAPTRENVLHFYGFDGENPTSIVSALRAARENARVLRHVISTEMWTCLNTFHRRISEYDPARIKRTGFNEYAVLIKDGCQMFQGVADGTLTRDESYDFFQIGKFIERADQTTRLLDAKSPYLDDDADPDDPVTLSRLNALLRSASAYHAYRRAHPRGVNPSAVVDFMLRNGELPRSVACALREIEEHLDGLAIETGPPLEESGRHALDDLKRVMARGSDGQDLPEFLDWIQARLAAIAEGVGRAYFARSF